MICGTKSKRQDFDADYVKRACACNGWLLSMRSQVQALPGSPLKTPRKCRVLCEKPDIPDRSRNAHSLISVTQNDRVFEKKRSQNRNETVTDWALDLVRRDRALSAHCHAPAPIRQALLAQAPACPHCGAPMRPTQVRCEACGRMADVFRGRAL